MRSEIIHFTTRSEIKHEAKLEAERNIMSLSQYVDLALREKLSRRKPEDFREEMRVR
jgi:hypothetical protein